MSFWTRRLLLLFVLSISSLEKSVSQSPDVSRLLRFFQETNGQFWTNRTHWNTTDKPICTWFGVQCSNDTSIITGLELPSNGLVGRIPKILYEISSLQTLNVKDNSITDAGFEGLSPKASNLKTVDVSQNGLTSIEGIQNAPDSLRQVNLQDNRLPTFPTQITSLHKLETLDISKNNIKGTLPTTIGKMTSLIQLNVYGNALTGQVPSEIGFLSNIQVVVLAENAFTGTIPTVVNKMKSLVTWSLHNHVHHKGELTGTLPKFHHLPDIQELFLEGNALTGSIPRDFLQNATTTNEMHIGLSYNQLTGTVPLELQRFKSAQLNIVGNYITHLPQPFCVLGTWMAGSVQLYGCNAIVCPNGTFNNVGRQEHDETPCQPCAQGLDESPYLGATSCLQHSSILEILWELYTKTSGTKWNHREGWEIFDRVNPADSADDGSSIEPCDFYGIDCLFNTIDTIDLHQNNLKGTIPKRLFELPHLTRLDLSRNAITMTLQGFQTLGEMGGVTELNIANTLQEELDGIGLCQSIRILDIGGLDLASVPEELLDLVGLQEISARASAMAGPLPTRIGNLRNLTRLDLFDNAFTGSIPSELGRLTNLGLLDLAENAFSGTLPTEMVLMTSLYKLQLHQTNGTLTGKLPAFDSFPNLVELLLDSNMFSGSIPTNFLAGVDDKTQPITIDLSNNAIEGTVPSELADFQNLTIRLQGNKITGIAPELCEKGEWMNGDVGRTGSCNAILCPSGMWNQFGRASDLLGSSCRTCPGSVYMGSTFCGDDKDPFPEKTILDSLFKFTGGTNWKSKANWTDSTVGVCFRQGVSCNETSDDNSGVTEVRLPGIGLYGRIPSSIFDLPELRVLDFSENEVELLFSGIDKAKKLEALYMNTTEISSLSGIDKAHSSLVKLHLSNNKISGTVPSELLKLSSATELLLSNNYFNGTIPSSISTLASVAVLDLSQNDLTGHIPSEIGLLTSLKVLNFNENVLSGIIATEFGKLSHLNTLSIAFQVELSGPLFSFSKNPFLTNLDLSHNSIGGSIPSDLLAAVDHSRAISVNLSGNTITGSIPKELDSFERLDIDLTGNKIDSLSNEFCNEDNAAWMNGKVGELGTCDAILCPPGFSAPEGRGRQEDTDGVCLPCPGGQEEAPFFGTPVCTLSATEQERNSLILLYQLANGPAWKIQTNWLSENSVCTWHGVKCVESEIVVSLEVPHNNLESSMDVTEHIFALKNLAKLDIRGNDVPLDFSRIPLKSTIQTMKLSSTGLKSLDGIGNARKLRELVVSNNYLSDVLPDELYTLTDLESLYLSFNWLSATLSSHIGKLVNLSKLYIDFNNFSGKIPSELGLLSKLESIVLSDNLFSGSIPNELGSLPKLQLFFADRISKPGPRLSGRLPAFDNLPALTALNLDHNDLSGSIPKTFLSGSPLSSFVFLGHNLLNGSIPTDLDSIPSIVLQLEGNQISDFPKQFCNNSEWMGGDIGRIGCDAFLCPPGTASPIGRANDTQSCQDCSSPDAANYYGSISCDAVTSERKILLRLYQRCGGIEWYRKDGWAGNDTVCQWFGVFCHQDGRVKALDLTANNLVDELPWEIFELQRLESLVLSYNPIGVSFGGLDKARRLVDLRLDSIGLASVKGLEQGTGLTSLNLRFNNLEGTFPQEILALTNLRELNAANNRFGSQVPSLSKLAQLRILRLGDNAFSGPLPSFEDMVVLTTIDLSDNRLSGTIPLDFLDKVSSKAMLTVDLANNDLTGGLPLELDRFENMTIYLRDNRIDELDAIFCDNKAWNGGDVEHFSCNALLCPPGTSAGIGRQSMSTINSSCQRCENSNIQYYGMTTCDPSSAIGRGTISLALVLGVTIFSFM